MIISRKEYEKALRRAKAEGIKEEREKAYLNKRLDNMERNFYESLYRVRGEMETMVCENMKIDVQHNVEEKEENA